MVQKWTQCGKKVCNLCGELKPREDYYEIKNTSRVSGRCKECVALASKEFKEKNPFRNSEANHKSHLKKTYGLTIEQYNELKEKQNHSCFVCGRHESELERRLAVDHNHKTREIRGLLCNYCNHRIVGKHTDGDLLRQIADYIEQGTGWFVPKKTRVKKRKPVRK